MKKYLAILIFSMVMVSCEKLEEMPPEFVQENYPELFELVEIKEIPVQNAFNATVQVTFKVDPSKLKFPERLINYRVDLTKESFDGSSYGFKIIDFTTEPGTYTVDFEQLPNVPRTYCVSLRVINTEEQLSPIFKYDCLSID